MSIDLNADVGEGFVAADAAILPLVTSANIACGGHAGDAATMRRTAELAIRHGVAIGAHPGYPDRDGFGRRPMAIDDDALRASLDEQLRALDAVVASVGSGIVHVKPHGALYNEAAQDRALASLLVETVRAWRSDVVLVGRAGSVLLEVVADAGLGVLAEGFADRAYAPDGSLRPRSQPGAVLTDPAMVAAQAVAIARDGRAPLEGGGFVEVAADTICVHGDAKGAVENARAVGEALAAAGVAVRRAVAP